MFPPARPPLAAGAIRPGASCNSDGEPGEPVLNDKGEYVWARLPKSVELSNLLREVHAAKNRQRTAPVKAGAPS